MTVVDIVDNSSKHRLVTLPSLFARPIALRHARRIVARYFNGSVSRVGPSVVLDVPSSVSIDSAPRSIGCAYYEAGLAELLRLLINGGGAVDHVRCIARGEGTCSWRAEWRPLS